MTVNRSLSGTVHQVPTVYGQSREGVPLNVWLPEEGRPQILIMAAIHGDESETTVVLSEALRSVPGADLRAAVILAANPDGLVLGTRCNAAGVDLNRNFPASNWSPTPVFHKSRRDEPRDIELSPGEHPASEPETRALLSLIDDLQPHAVVTLHAALACIDDPDESFLGRQLSAMTGLPLHRDIGYPTPGSFGSWAGEEGLSVITYELEAASAYELKDRHSPVMIELMTGKVAVEV